VSCSPWEKGIFAHYVPLTDSIVLATAANVVLELWVGCYMFSESQNHNIYALESGIRERELGMA
jgi:hypothetical protein